MDGRLELLEHVELTPSPRTAQASVLLRAALTLLAVFPAAMLGGLIWWFSVDVPFWDQWAIGWLFKQSAEGTLRFADLFQQHNESRKVFPKLLFLGMGWLTGWNVRVEMAVSFLLACTASLCAARLIRRTAVFGPYGWLVAWFLINLLIFAPVQHQNWLWGIQIVVFLPVALLMMGLVIIQSSARVETKTAAGAVLATVATFSYANGLLLWVLLGAVLAVFEWRALRTRWWLAAGWVAAFAATVFIYFHGYERPAAHPPLWDALRQPVQTVEFFLAFLGAPLGSGYGRGSDLGVSILCGLAMLAILCTCVAYITYQWRDEPLRRRAAPWLALAAYALISALLTSAGRVGLGVDQALASRYTTFAIYLPVALVVLLPLVLAHATSPGWVRHVRAAQICTFLATAMMGLHVLTSEQAVQWIKMTRNDRLQNLAAVHWAAFVGDNYIEDKVYPDPALLVQIAGTLSDLGLLRPPVREKPTLADAAEPGEVYGRFDQLARHNVWLRASGWAILPHRKMPADAVLLAWEMDDGSRHLHALLTRRYLREDVAEELAVPAYNASGWVRVIHHTDVPPQAVRLTAWAYDALRAEAYLLDEGVPVTDDLR